MPEYCGYKQIVLSDQELAEFYQSDKTESYGVLTNEYAVFTNDVDSKIEADTPVSSVFRWNGSKFVGLNMKPIKSKWNTDVRAKNVHQAMAIDMLHNDDITVKLIAGRFGSGKTFLMCATAIEMLESGKYDKIIFVRNNIEVKNTKPIGHLPGENDDKLWPYAAPLADHVGGEEGLRMLIGRGKVELVHLGFMRGRDIKRSIIFCTEAENLTKEHIQLLISRVGEGSTIWFDGDLKQRDADVFVKNSGMETAVDRLSGHPRFGYVKLVKPERSETAAMADLLD